MWWALDGKWQQCLDCDGKTSVKSEEKEEMKLIRQQLGTVDTFSLTDLLIFPERE